MKEGSARPVLRSAKPWLRRPSPTDRPRLQSAKARVAARNTVRFHSCAKLLRFFRCGLSTGNFEECVGQGYCWNVSRQRRINHEYHRHSPNLMGPKCLNRETEAFKIADVGYCTRGCV